MITHQRTISGVTAPPSRHRSGGRASKSNQSSEAGGLLLSPLAASAPKTSGDSRSPASSPQATSACRIAARAAGVLSLAAALRRAGIAAGSARSASHCAAASRVEAVPVSDRSASSRAPGWVRRTLCAKRRLVAAAPTAASATAGSS